MFYKNVKKYVHIQAHTVANVYAKIRRNRGREKSGLRGPRAGKRGRRGNEKNRRRKSGRDLSVSRPSGTLAVYIPVCTTVGGTRT